MYNFLFLKSNRNFKHELSPSKPLSRSTQSLILRPKYSLNFSKAGEMWTMIMTIITIQICCLRSECQYFHSNIANNCLKIGKNSITIIIYYKGRIYGGNICAGAPLKDSCTVSFISIFLWQKYVKNVFQNLDY